MVALGERTVPTGQELLAEFIQYGNQKPFEEIVRRYAGMVFNVCFRITKDKHEAEDATQAVFLTLALQARRGADIKALGPWLQQVAKRLSLDTRRSKKRRKTREERHHIEQTIRQESILGDTLPSADMDELKTILHEELQKLPAKYRMPLILHYFGGLSRDEMAAELNCKPSTLGVRIFRGREMLAGRLSGRGIHISAGVLAALLGYAVKRAVSESLIASTSHAATAMLAGYDGSGYASANVIGLTRRATSALAFGKVRITAITLMMAGASLGAGARALGILPQINIQQMISNQMNRIIRPLFSPFTPSLRVDAQTLPAKPTASPTVASTDSGDANVLKLIAPIATTPPAHVAPPAVTVANSNGQNNQVVSSANSPLQSPFTQPVTLGSRGSGETPVASSDQSASNTAASADPIDPSTGTPGGGAASASSMADAFAAHAGDSLPTRSVSAFSPSLPNVILSNNNLVIGSASSGSTSSKRNATGTATSASPASQIAVIQIPAIDGTVTESSSGVLQGYGKIDRTGALVINSNGKVVAWGGGVDQTLDLTSFSMVQTAASPVVSQSALIGAATPPVISAFTTTPTLTQSTALSSTNALAPTPTPNPNAGSSIEASINTAGWYAIDHGRLSLSLQPGADRSVLTWGEDPNAAKLSLVNSVRLNLDSVGTDTANGSCPSMPTELSLLASDRSDAPNLSQLFGVPIGLWQVDPSVGALPSADITICYDAMLADELGASPSSIDLWTLGGPGSSWEAVNPSTMLLDTSDHLISGYADDISYFAVTAVPAPGTDVDRLVADHLSVVAAQPSPSIGSGTSGIPEPTAMLPLIAAGSALLGRRRRLKS